MKGFHHNTSKYSLKKLGSFTKDYQCAIVHEDRVILENDVYRMTNSKFQKMFQMDHEGIISLLVVNQKYIIAGNNKNSKIIVFEYFPI